MFRNRQSSLPVTPELPPCVHTLPNEVALSTPCHLPNGVGGIQRKLPTGGAAYGIPRNSAVFLCMKPLTGPLVVLIAGVLTRWPLGPMGIVMSECVIDSYRDPAVATAV